MRDFNFCNLWIGGVPVGPPVGAASPRSAARRCASLALGSGGEGQTAEALHAVRVALDQSISNPAEAATKVRSALLELGTLEEDYLAGDNSGTEPNAQPPPIVVRCPAGTTEHYWEAQLDVPNSGTEEAEKGTFDKTELTVRERSSVLICSRRRMA